MMLLLELVSEKDNRFILIVMKRQLDYYIQDVIEI